MLIHPFCLDTKDDLVDGSTPSKTSRLVHSTLGDDGQLPAFCIFLPPACEAYISIAAATAAATTATLLRSMELVETSGPIWKVTDDVTTWFVF